MKNLKFVSNQDLNNHLQSLIKSEREILSEILIHIAEADRRRLYLDYAYPSLFEYLTKHLGYSAGSAQRRIDSARLSKEIPGLIKLLEKGEVNLSQVSLLQKTVRQVEKVKDASGTQKRNDLKVSAGVKLRLIDSMKGKSFQDSQVLVAQGLNLEVKVDQKIVHQADESVRLELNLSKDQWQKLLKMRDLLSHSLPSGSWDQVLEYVADRVIESKTKIKVKTEDGIPAKARVKAEAIAKASTSAQVLRRRTAIPANLKKQVLGEVACCQYKSPITQKVCTSTWQLEVHHLKPVWAGGGNELKNLSVLCGQHNKHVYRQEVGIKLR